MLKYLLFCRHVAPSPLSPLAPVCFLPASCSWSPMPKRSRGATEAEATLAASSFFDTLSVKAEAKEKKKAEASAKKTEAKEKKKLEAASKKEAKEKKKLEAAAKKEAKEGAAKKKKEAAAKKKKETKAALKILAVAKKQKAEEEKKKKAAVAKEIAENAAKEIAEEWARRGQHVDWDDFAWGIARMICDALPHDSHPWLRVVGETRRKL